MVITTTSDARSEIAFFDLETTIPTRPGQDYAILEFGAILVCPKKLIELRNYSTLVRPDHVSQITERSVRCNGITWDAVRSAPSFAEIANTVYDILHGRIWVGHNILEFDCPIIKKAFAGINRPAPEPRGTIDSLPILTQRFGRRAGDMKMATLATHFDLGQQTHRSLDDVRMNLEVLKKCATVLFLESCLPDIFPENSWVSPTAMTRGPGNGNTSEDRTTENASIPSSSIKFVRNKYCNISNMVPSPSMEEQLQQCTIPPPLVVLNQRINITAPPPFSGNQFLATRTTDLINIRASSSTVTPIIVEGKKFVTMSDLVPPVFQDMRKKKGKGKK